MIAYEILVQTIADWRAGVRPSAPAVPPPRPGAPQPVQEVESGMVDLDDAQEYSEAEYGEAEYATETYEDDEA